MTRFWLTKGIQTAALMAVMGLGGPALANGQNIAFDRSWKEQGFLRFTSNDYALQGRALGVESRGTVSVLWRPLDKALVQAQGAGWQWQVSEGVPATDLTRKGGDDRNLALYFVFVDAETAKTLKRSSARRLLKNPSTRALVYVWGGAHDRGAILPSPYSNGLRTKVLRNTRTGSFSENVDLAADYRAAFGAAPGVLVGLAVTADSDDTNGRIRAQIANLQLR